MRSSPSPTRTRRGSPFIKGARVLCFHASSQYEARILDVRNDPLGQQFLVHYMGWKDRYDEWVTLSQLSPFDEQVLQAAREKRMADGIPNTPPSGRSDRPVAKKPTRRNNADSLKPINISAEPAAITNAEQKLSTPSKVKLPAEIRQQLSADYVLLCHRGLVHQLPKFANVRAIVEDFRSKRVRAQGSDRSLNAFCSGLISHFDALLGRCMLYPLERHQYLQIRANPSAGSLKPVSPTFVPSEVYGCEHLCRQMLIVTEALQQDVSLWARCDADVMSVFERHLDAFLEYLALRVYRDCDNTGTDPVLLSSPLTDSSGHTS